VGRPRLIGLVAGISTLLVLLAPSSALAGTFTWSLPGDFTTTTPGSNPEQKYGAPSWTYGVTGGSLSFSANADGNGNPGWSDANGDYIADTGSAIALQSTNPLMGSAHSVTIKWTNPFSTKQTVAVKSTLSAALGCGLTQSPSGSSLTLSPGASVTWTLAAPALPGPIDCTATGGISISASTPGPTVTLNSLGTAPLHTSSPQFTGTASTGFSDSSKVTVNVYSGTDTSSSPVRQLSANVNSSGGFSAQVSPALPDGEYTAVASQTSGAGTGKSPVVTFQIKVHPPALTLYDPPADAWVGRARLSFGGRAGHELGDAHKVTVELYRGQSAGGTPVGSRQVSVHHGNWSTRWRGLRLGYYTVVAVQSDDAGHTTRTPPHTFRLVPRTSAFGSRVTVAGKDASVLIGCLASSTTSCHGTVLVVTKGSYRTAPGGPSGPLEVLFANVRIPGGTMGLISARVPGAVMRVLGRLHHVEVVVTSNLSHSGHRSVTRGLRVS
jgi:hypothetical protein